MDFTGYSVSELVEKRDEINALIKGLRANARDNAKGEAEARDIANRANGALKAGATVSFLFNKEEAEGKVVRVSEKTVTIESDAFAKGKGYKKYSDILEVYASEDATEEVAE